MVKNALKASFDGCKKTFQFQSTMREHYEGKFQRQKSNYVGADEERTFPSLALILYLFLKRTDSESQERSSHACLLMDFAKASDPESAKISPKRTLYQSEYS